MLIGRPKADRGVYHVAPGADFPAYSTGLGLLETRLLRLYDTRCSVQLARPRVDPLDKFCARCGGTLSQLPDITPPTMEATTPMPAESTRNWIRWVTQRLSVVARSLKRGNSLVVDSVTAFPILGPGWAFPHILYLSVLLRRTGCSSIPQIYVIYAPCTKSEYLTK